MMDYFDIVHGDERVRRQLDERRENTLDPLGRSTTVITIGMSIERRRMAEVWITLDIPNPATPRVTVAPLSPLRRSILTIAM
jgi:hypothetical protein